MDSMRRSAARGGTRKKRAPRSGSSRFAPPSHGWDPKNQRPELWNLYNTRVAKGETSACSRCRTGPSSTSGNTSTWRAFRSCRCISPKSRPVVDRDGALIMVDDERLPLLPGEKPQKRSSVSARSAAIRSPARSRSQRRDSRGHRRRDAHRAHRPNGRAALIDQDESAYMEAKKREGYF